MRVIHDRPRFGTNPIIELEARWTELSSRLATADPAEVARLKTELSQLEQEAADLIAQQQQTPAGEAQRLEGCVVGAGSSEASARTQGALERTHR